jgi:SSS family solute:Na+ symporter
MGLGGRQFGTWITWFLVGGDFYTAYTVIAVPALVYAVGAYGFFALPYTIIVYPFVFAVMPVLWKTAYANGYVTAADVVHGIYNSRGLELAVAITGMVATMPYIALQTDRDGRGDQGDGANRRIANRCGLHHSCTVHL